MSGPSFEPATPAESGGAEGSGGAVELDRLIHQPARLLIVANLAVVEEADFIYLAARTRLTAGNISSHMARLEEAGYVDIEKSFAGKRPRTTYRLTEAGRTAFERYRAAVDDLLRIDPAPDPAR